MATHNLPERASLEYLKKIAKDRLAALRRTDPEARLAEVQRAIAREYGFANWQALKAEVDRRRAPAIAAFFQACESGDVASMEDLLARDASLVRERRNGDATGLHLAASHPDAVRVLLAHGADPNARDVGDNVSPLHVAAANRALDSVRLLLDAGADVHGKGDLHNGDVIGWATARGNEAVIDLLLARGARHHIFTAMALGDRDLVQRIVEEHPEALQRRRSRFENEHTVLHAAFAPPDGLGWLAGQPDYPMLQLLVDLGADLEATDNKGRTPLALAMLRGDTEAMRIMTAAGAKPAAAMERTGAPLPQDMAALAASVKKASPMFWVQDMRETVRWYEAVGFTVADRYELGAELLFARLTFGGGELALSPGGATPTEGVSMWFFTDQIEAIYQRLKGAQLREAQASLAGEASNLPDVRFEEDLYQPFYGGRQFGIKDCNGLSLVFYQPEWLGEPRSG